jgi:hypothetical protein
MARREAAIQSRDVTYKPAEPELKLLHVLLHFGPHAGYCRFSTPCNGSQGSAMIARAAFRPELLGGGIIIVDGQ